MTERRPFLPPLVSFLSAAIFLCTSMVQAQSASPAESAGPAPPERLAPVTVTGTFVNPATGRSTMDRQVMDALPAGNGSVNELLALFPDVQLGEGVRTASRAGEILPPNLSISGGKSFDNLFLIDALNNDSLLDPAASNPMNVDNVPGHPQTVFPDAGLIERLSVYDSNVPARYGGFTGGVIVVETRDPAPQFGGLLFYRGTSDSLTRFHLQDDEEEPRFRKHHLGFDLNLPLGPTAGLLGSLRQIRSTIPVRHLGEAAQQERRLTNYYLKGVQQGGSGRLGLTFLATPYREETFLPGIKNSDFVLEGGGYQLQGNLERYLSFGTLQLSAGFGRSENSRQAPPHLRQWLATDSRPWGRLTGSTTSEEGGFGDVERTQQELQLRSSLLLEPLRTGPVNHQIEAGVEYALVRGTYERKETSHGYLGAKVEPFIICREDTFACIDEEQFFTYRRILDAGKASARIQLYDLFVEDRLQAGRLALRPGVRLSYDDFMGNVNLAPRLAATYDLLGAGRTVLIGGWNRYYGRTLLTYKLREAQTPFRSETRGALNFSPTAWETSFSGTNVTRFSRLDTPYTDEWTAGLDQALLGGRFSLKYVQRQGRDEFARQYGDRQPDGMRYFTLSNAGRSRHESWRAGWERSWQRQLLSANLTWQESAGSNESYDAVLVDAEVQPGVWFDGRFIPRGELPRSDYHRPWTANLTWIAQLPRGFRFTNVATYRSGYRAVVDTGERRPAPAGEGLVNPATGEPLAEALSVYEERRLKDGVVFDWVLAWQSPGRRNLLLTLEVENVFNSRLQTGCSGFAYEIGRQVWLGAQLRY
ncbi:MAG: hypothetical protein IH614_13225 [Desulfuromonadales bacterium]|nr:hypothetical protein [Desulfuromonadales bacterium]